MKITPVVRPSDGPGEPPHNIFSIFSGLGLEEGRSDIVVVLDKKIGIGMNRYIQVVPRP